MQDNIAPFALLKALDDGKVMDDFHQGISELVAAVRMTHSKGSVTLKITVEPGDVDVLKVDVQGDVTAKIPHIKRSGETFYVTDQNGLSRRNPRQPALPPNTVPMPSVYETELDGQSRAAGEKA